MALEIRPTEHHPKDDECTKRVNFSGYNDHITPKRAIFSGYSFHRWNVRRAYAIRPYLVTRKHGTFSIPHTYPAYFLGLGRGLDFFLPSFLVSRQGPYRDREVFPGTFLGWILYSSLFLDPFFSPHTYPANFPGLGRGLDFLLPSFLVSRQGPYRGREVFPGTFLGWILYSSLFLDPFSRLHHVPCQLPRPR